MTPALVEWQLISSRNIATTNWHVAADFRDTLPIVKFTTLYARFTRQNHPWGRGGRGRYRFYLAHDLDTRRLPNGTYRVQVRVTDTRGNVAYGTRDLTIANGV